MLSTSNSNTYRKENFAGKNMSLTNVCNELALVIKSKVFEKCM